MNLYDLGPGESLAVRTVASVITGCAAFGVGCSLGVWNQTGRVVELGFLTAGLAGAGTWTLLLIGWIRELSPEPYYPPAQPAPVEVEPDPEPPTRTVRLEIWQPEAQRADFLNLPVSWPAVVQAARLLERGESFALNALAGAGKPLSRSEFEALRDNFLGAGFLAWRNPAATAQGCDLTPAGRAMIRRICESENR